MNQTILLDQYSLSEPGSDRGLGRYAAMMAVGITELSDVAVERLIRTPYALKAPDAFLIQRDIWRLRLDRGVPYHSTSVYHLPIVKDRPWICSIQDVIPLDLDDYKKLGIKSRMLFANARRSDMILANSKYTKSRIASRLGISPNRIKICSLPISKSFTADASGESLSFVTRLLSEAGIDSARPFVVALADLRTPDPRKRYHWIDEIAESLAARNVPMLVTGRGISQEDFPNSVVVPPLTDIELSALYSLAVAMYYPTAYEGQGLPPQEAMASGCPVIAYRNTSVEEVVESSEFLLDDPLPWELQVLADPLPSAARNEVVSKILMWTDSPEDLLLARRLAVKLAGKYSWESFSSSLENFYESYFKGRAL
ncbi:glycosyltransferase [Arthrobacter sp. NicSoilB8]|uniref:glycosyltransferase n=1 Tax=Arthrobacter sp. NicSoilB8 TaxID=2830998 RepID=UPI001CC7835E|nr:glycosyltransferase [Arthrobacter sp. NicSoilB8]BCW72567.1 hypothetical protein NicSoilB8_36110 [Arthrobacter sp. NicSoilB8]